MLPSLKPEVSNCAEVLNIDHVPQMVSLYALCFQNPWPEDFFESILTSSIGLGIGVFNQKSRLLGFCLSRWVLDEAEILTIVVNQADRQKGLGHLLLSTNCSYLRKKGVSKVFLEVDERNQAALRLYHNASFQPIGERANYYLNHEKKPSNAIVLELFLNK